MTSFRVQHKHQKKYKKASEKCLEGPRSKKQEARSKKQEAVGQVKSARQSADEECVPSLAR
jgi:hypothetical protein